MATTGLGTPYVESGDLVSAYPTASQSLATSIDNRVVNVFADSAARSTAIPSPSEGQVSYLEDTDALETYDGSAWVGLGGGKILQVVQGTSSTQTSSTSTSYVTTGLSATITPSSSSNQVLVVANTGAQCNNANNHVVFSLFRGSVAGTNLGNGNNGGTQIYPGIYATASISFLDSPSTTSAQTYTLGMRTNGATTSVIAQNGNSTGTILLIEVSA